MKFGLNMDVRLMVNSLSCQADDDSYACAAQLLAAVAVAAVVVGCYDE